MSSQSEKELSGAESTPNAALVREQLRRILAHPLFTNSKRYPVLLAYTVEQTLDGNAAELKERTIGVEAFGREPDYDVNLDPVVRTTAAEVRKRLIQYYYNQDHAGEMVIELSVGSYIPSFREPAAPQTNRTPEPVPKTQSSAGEIVAWKAVEQRPSGLTSRRRISIGIALLFAALLGFGIGRVKLPRQPSNLQRFWEPITATSNRITYCVGEATDAAARRRDRTEDNPVGELNLSDVTTLARSIGPLVLGKSTFRIVSAQDADFTELREGPIVLIGAYNNPWTLRITQDLPFGFESVNQTRGIVDRKNPQRSWTYQWQVPNTELAQDYAIVARIHDNVTGQPVVILAGILAEGTEAASEVVSNPEYLDALLQKAPRNWDQKNLEAVIETHVIERHPGPPTVVAVETW